MLSNLFSISFTFFLLMNSIGNIPIFISLLKELPQKRQLYLILREMLIALGILLLFYFLGDALLGLLDIKQDSVQIAGAIILFIIALNMVFPRPKDTTIEIEKEEPFIVPLAVPLIAGPAILATVTVYSHQDHPPLTIILAIFIAWSLSLVVLLSSPLLTKALGKRGITACEKLMGLILTLIAIEMFLKGLIFFNERH